MGLKLVRNQERFVFEIETEKEVLEDARRYFGDAPTLMIEGLGYDVLRNTGGRYFNRIKSGEHVTHKTSSVSVENWRRVIYYALKFEDGERYDPQKFDIPEL